MFPIRRVAGCALAGMMGGACMLLVVPAGSAASVRSVSPPSGERTPAVGQLFAPPFTPDPTPSGGTARITVLGTGFAICAAAQGEIESSENVSALAAGDASLHWDGVNPIPTVPLDADLGLSAILELSQAGIPGDHQVARQCAADAGDMGAGGAAVIPPPTAALPEPPVQAPDASPVPLPREQVAGDKVQPDTISSSPDGSAADRQADASALKVAGQADRAVTDSLLPGSGPAPLGPVIGVLLVVGAAMVVPSVVAFGLQNRKGQNWVRANVRAEPTTAPAVVETIPQMDYPWPTLGVRLALRPDSGTQALTKVEQ